MTGAEAVGLPPRPFLYTLDQIATLLSLSVSAVKNKCYFEGRTPGVKKTSELSAVNIANEGEKPDWRVSEAEFIRWMRYHGFRIYDRSWERATPRRRR